MQSYFLQNYQHIFPADMYKSQFSLFRIKSFCFFVISCNSSLTVYTLVWIVYPYLIRASPYLMLCNNQKTLPWWMANNNPSYKPFSIWNLPLEQLTYPPPSRKTSLPLLSLCFIPVYLVSCAKSLPASVHKICVFLWTMEGSLIREEPVEGACGMLIRNSSNR